MSEPQQGELLGSTGAKKSKWRVCKNSIKFISLSKRGVSERSEAAGAERAQVEDSSRLVLLTMFQEIPRIVTTEPDPPPPQ